MNQPDATRPTRPTGHVRIASVDGGLFQVQCVCRWRSRRIRHLPGAETEASMHLATCGMCVRLGRDWMDVCGCMNCEHRRRAHARQTALRPPVPMEDTCRDPSPETATSCSSTFASSRSA